MDKHYLTPLFSPESIVVFAGQADDPAQPDAAWPRRCARPCGRSAYGGTLQFLDIHTSGTLADLAQSRADLAIIALPPDRRGRGAGDGRPHALPRRAGDLQRHRRRRRPPSCSRSRGAKACTCWGPTAWASSARTCKLNASAAGPLASAGPLALVSQSGALTASMLDWAQPATRVGFSAVVSLGPEHRGRHRRRCWTSWPTTRSTQSILVYMEGISNARRFMSALRAAANAKPVVVLKAGRKPAGNEAALTHCGAIVGSDDVFDAALRRAGAVRVRSFVELFSAAKCLASRYRPVGRRLAIVTNGGGPGVLAADWVNEIGLELGQLSPTSAEALSRSCRRWPR